jgi:predicted TIM-barrel fold metal-dependent hydrolase
MSLPHGHSDMERRLSVIDHAGVTAQVLSVGALDIGLARKRASLVARRINDALSEICLKANGRFRFVGSLALDDPAELVKEMDRLAAMGAVGLGITTTVRGKSLDAEEFRGFWQEAGRRELVVLVHPTFPLTGPSGDRGEFLTTAYLGETAMAATKLVLGGILDQSPGIRLVWSHLGGGLAMLIDRLDRVYRRYPTCPKPPSFYLRRCFYDTVCTHGPALDCARATFGADSALVRHR